MLAIATEADFAAWMGSIQARIEGALSRHLPGSQHAPARLHQAMRYAALEGGKRVRPLLTLPPANWSARIRRDLMSRPARSK